jgi:hypothetical protein
MAESVRPYLVESMDNLARQARHALERKPARDAAAFFFPGAFDLAFLTPQVTAVLDRGFHADEIQSFVGELDAETIVPVDLNRVHQIDEPDGWLAKQLARGDAVAIRRPHDCLLDDL